MCKIQFWQDKDKKKIDPRLYSDRAEELVKTMKKDFDVNKKVNKRTQVRKFYDEVMRLHMEARNLDMSQPEKREQWEILLPMIHMLSAKAAYAKGRELVSDNFRNFIKTSVEQIEDPGDLALFANFFEAFMGFYRYHLPAS